MFYELESYSENNCLVSECGKVLSYADLVNEMQPIETALRGHKRLVVILCDNNLATIICYLAALRANSSVMLLSGNIEDALLENIVNEYRPNFIFSHQENLFVNRTQTKLEHRQFESGLYRISETKLDLFEDLAVLLSTSGSTGSPKFVRLSYKNIQSNADSIARYLHLDSSERPITVLPMAYSYGLSVINSHLLVGASILVTNQSLMSKSFWSFFADQKATSISGVPYTYEMLKRIRFERRDLTQLNSMTQAGGKLDPSLVREFAELADKNDIKFYVMYGQTEATARISYVPPTEIASRSDSIGVAIPGGELSIQSEEEEGELVYRGNNVMLGYSECLSDLAAGDVLEGVLHTGDIARIDKDGYCYITGRLKRILKMYGYRVNLDDIDSHIRSCGIEGVSGGKDNCLHVVITDSAQLDLVKKSIIDTFHFDHKSVVVSSIDRIPRSDSGKILYAEIFDGIV